MSLPYPHEVETQELPPTPAGPVNPIDLDARVRDLVHADGQHVVIAGCELSVPASESAEKRRHDVRRVVAKRLRQRRPNADEATWRAFVRKLQGVLSERTELDGTTIREIKLLIDGL